MSKKIVKNKKRVLVACEESQVVCKAFRVRGFEAYSCDIQPCTGERPEWHIQGDVLDIIQDNWDMMIAHPPCTYLSYAGNRWWGDPGRLEKRLEALSFFAKLWQAPIKHICIENPRGCASPTIAKYSQQVHPYHFGDEESKLTWLWLKNLPLLEKTNIVKPKIYYYKKNGEPMYKTEALPQNKDKAKIRSKTHPCIAEAMAIQWGNYILVN